MSGAIRPPWIDKEDFYHMPFNYCDRWCEKCNLNSLCKVFQEGEKAKKEWLAAGKDPDTWEYVFESVSKSLQEAFVLLAKEAEKQGIDLEKIDYSEEEEQPKPKALRIYRLVREFSDTIQKTLKDLQVVTADTDQNLVLRDAEVLSYYSTLIPSKVYRAAMSKFREEKDPLLEEFCGDSRISAFIVVEAFNEIICSLTELINHPPLRPMREKLFHLRKVAINLKEATGVEFAVEEEKRLN